MKILIVDNDVSTLITLKALLSGQADFEIETASSGQECLDMIKAHSDYALILLDIMMPQMSGMDVCKVMAGDPGMRNIPVLLMSSAMPIPPAEFQASLEKFSGLSVVKGVLEKPFVIENLIDQIYKKARK
jgi:CheY-like chemotaxis protein